MKASDLDRLLDGIDGALTAKVEALLGRVNHRLDEMDADAQRVAEQLAQVMRHLSGRQQPTDSDDHDNPDKSWTCRKCAALLGFYDPDEDVLRIRVRDFTMHQHAGVGGWISVICRGCGEANTLRDESEGVDELRVTGGVVTLSVARLEELLMAAVAEGSGEVRLSVVE